MAKWHSRYGIPVSAHPHAVGIHPVKDTAAAGGPGYKCVSLTSFKQYAHEQRKLPLRDHTVGQLQKMLRSNDGHAAATELMRRHKTGRHLPLTVDDFKLIRQFTGYGKPAKQTRKYRQSPDEVVHRRVF